MIRAVRNPIQGWEKSDVLPSRNTSQQRREGERESGRKKVGGKKRKRGPVIGVASRRLPVVLDGWL